MSGGGEIAGSVLYVLDPSIYEYQSFAGSAHFEDQNADSANRPRSFLAIFRQRKRLKRARQFLPHELQPCGPRWPEYSLATAK